MADDPRSHDDDRENHDNAENNGADNGAGNGAGNGGADNGNGPSDPLSQMFNQLFGGAGPQGFSMHMGPGMGAGMGSGDDDDDHRQQPDFNAIFGQLRALVWGAGSGRLWGPRELEHRDRVGSAGSGQR
ncbi:hypothetical protein QP228_004825 [Pseudoglutamicibacter cumminsii]|uniref:hypothetical protein n=1 Tax=Pseudoglutamicibacter cumminsii TaxID=156979 RepID=UPI002ABCDA61|nr:hypothetical protein [Pseudoglutamicibacter cumminsii]MDZ3745323.1 hypothetical protein [Pseudoglutamicibacter cumminsii]